MHLTADPHAAPLPAAPPPGQTRARLLRQSSSRVAAARRAQTQMHVQAQNQAQVEAEVQPAQPVQIPSQDTKQIDKLIRLQSLLTEFLHA